MKVRTLRRKLESLVSGENVSLGEDDLRAINALVASLKLNDSKSVEELCEIMGLDIASWFRPRPRPQPPTPSQPVAPPTTLVERARAAFHDDQSFRSLIADWKSDRKVTKAVLASLYAELFGPRDAPSAKTKPQLLQDIADERLTRARHEKAVRALAGTAAE
jgi:hypothetical protein